MKFRTEVHFNEVAEKIQTEDRIFSIGSCFSTEMSTLLKRGQLQTLNNPFGTIFNPYSVNTALRRIHSSSFYTEEDLIAYQDQFISLDHHSGFNSEYVHKTLEKINSNIEKSNLFLQSANWVMITYGSSFIYEFLPKNKLVANCHKIPDKFFSKRLLTSVEIRNSVRETISFLKDICPEGVQLLFTVSPVRHTKDGMMENQRSKSLLISNLHDVLEETENCTYLPVYEMMMDDLRDYRFYKEDMIHPTQQAVNYIFEKFGNAYFSDETMDFIEENFKIMKALEHRTSDDQSPKHHEFLENLKGRIALQQTMVKHKIFTES